MTTQTVNILLVEDDDIDAMSIERTIKKMKIANPLYRAKDGIEALNMLRAQGEDKIPPPHLLLVDLNMPRMNGIDFVSTIRQDPNLANTIIFMLTTSKRDEDIVASYNLHVAGYMVKNNTDQGFTKVISMLDCYWRLIEFPH